MFKELIGAFLSIEERISIVEGSIMQHFQNVSVEMDIPITDLKGLILRHGKSSRICIYRGKDYVSDFEPVMMGKQVLSISREILNEVSKKHKGNDSDFIVISLGDRQATIDEVKKMRKGGMIDSSVEDDEVFVFTPSYSYILLGEKRETLKLIDYKHFFNI